MLITQKHPRLIPLLLLLLLVILFFGLTFFWSWSKINRIRVVVANNINPLSTSTVLIGEEIKTKPQPKTIRGIYLTAYSAGNPTKVDKIITQAKNSQINAVVIDIKDYSGYLSYDSSIPLVNDLKLEQIKIKDVKALTEKLHQNNLYAIARISVFQDTAMAEGRPEWAVQNKNTGKIWRDRKNLAWLDPANMSVWKYHVGIAQEAVSLGFDEVNLDYIRFPSDGSISAMSFPKWKNGTKADVIKSFFAYFSKEMINEPVYTSADLFGLTTTVKNDMNIGQLLENAAPYFDYLCPMVYPSHYPNGYLGYSNPATQPYQIVYKAMASANERLASSTPARAKMRPWIQDFDLGATYTAEMIRQEIKAAKDGGADGYLVWDPKNIYTWEAFK